MNAIGHYRIIFSVFINGGYGDIRASVNLIEIFKKHVPVNQIALSLSKDKEVFLSVFKEKLKDIKIIHEDDKQAVDAFNPTLVLGFNHIGPGSPLFEREPKIPSLIFEEYGNDPHDPDQYLQSNFFREFSLGINTKENPDTARYGLGIFIQDDLVAYYKDKRNENAHFRLVENLPKLPSKLLSAVTDDQTAEEFSQKNSLYFSYLNGHEKKQYKRAFIGAAILLNEDKRDLVVVFPGGPGFLVPQTLKETHLLSKQMVSFLVEHGFTHCEFRYSRSLTYDFQKQLLPLTGNKTKCLRKLTIVSSPLVHEDFILLLKAAEKEVILTGDESISEGLALGKKTFYECLSHKNRFSTTLSDLINQICQTDVTFRYAYITTKEKKLAERIVWLRDHFKKIAPKWDQFIQEVITNQNCEPKILESVAKFLE